MADRPEDYRWSSYHTNALGQNDTCITSHPVYTALGATPAARRAAYRAFFAKALPADTLKEIRQSLNQGVALGSDTFRDQIETMLKRRAKPGSRGRPAKGEIDESA